MLPFQYVVWHTTGNMTYSSDDNRRTHLHHKQTYHFITSSKCSDALITVVDISCHMILSISWQWHMISVSSYQSRGCGAALTPMPKWFRSSHSMSTTQPINQKRAVLSVQGYMESPKANPSRITVQWDAHHPLYHLCRGRPGCTWCIWRNPLIR